MITQKQQPASNLIFSNFVGFGIFLNNSKAFFRQKNKKNPKMTFPTLNLHALLFFSSVLGEVSLKNSQINYSLIFFPSFEVFQVTFSLKIVR